MKRCRKCHKQKRFECKLLAALKLKLLQLKAKEAHV